MQFQEISRKTSTERIRRIERAITFFPQKAKKIADQVRGYGAVYNHLEAEVAAGRLIKTPDKEYHWPPNAIVDGVTREMEERKLTRRGRNLNTASERQWSNAPPVRPLAPVGLPEADEGYEDGPDEEEEWEEGRDEAPPLKYRPRTAGEMVRPRRLSRAERIVEEQKARRARFNMLTHEELYHKVRRIIPATPREMSKKDLVHVLMTITD